MPFRALTMGMFVMMFMAQSCACAHHMVVQGFAPKQSTAPVKNKPAVNVKKVLQKYPGRNRLHLRCPRLYSYHHNVVQNSSRSGHD